MAFCNDASDRRRRTSDCLRILSGSTHRWIKNFLPDLFLKLGLFLLFVTTVDLPLVLEFDELQHIVILFNSLELLLQPGELIVVELGHTMILDLLLLFCNLLFNG